MSSSISLKPYNSFAVDAVAAKIYQPSCLDDLKKLPTTLAQPFYILGEGSNTLFVEQAAPVVIKPNFIGITVEELADCFLLTVAASENWHQLVTYCVDNNMPGLENLALIPGSVGAAPVQNIGAYGVDFSMFCREVTWFDFSSSTLKTLSTEQCQFSYRDSIFKAALKNKGLITQVTLALPKQWQPVLNYAGLEQLPKTVTSREVMLKVMAIRQQKLPDPNVIANAGSFFKNPVVSLPQFKKLTTLFGDMPHYNQADQQVKLAAGWLIEHAGLKGYRQGDVGVHAKQALVLVNYASDSGQDIVELARYVRDQVKIKFNVELEPEVRLISHHGETTLDELTYSESR